MIDKKMIVGVTIREDIVLFEIHFFFRIKQKLIIGKTTRIEVVKIDKVDVSPIYL